MAAGTVKIIQSDRRLGVTAFETDIQTWLTANATGVIKDIQFVGDVWFAILEVPPSA